MLMKTVIAIVLASAMLVACAEPAPPASTTYGWPPASPTDKPATPTTLSIAKQLKQDLDEIARELGYDDYEDGRQDMDRYEAELKAWMACIESAVGDDWLSCTPPEG
jgi:hypothetical protein